MQGVDNGGLGGVVGGLVSAASDADGSIAGVVIGTKLFMLASMISGVGLVAELGINQGESVMGRQILGIEGKRLLKFCHSLVEELLLPLRIAVLHFGAFEIGLAVFVGAGVPTIRLKASNGTKRRSAIAI